jgi:hypothetical protein
MKGLSVIPFFLASLAACGGGQGTSASGLAGSSGGAGGAPDAGTADEAATAATTGTGGSTGIAGTTGTTDSAGAAGVAGTAGAAGGVMACGGANGNGPDGFFDTAGGVPVVPVDGCPATDTASGASGASCTTYAQCTTDAGTQYCLHQRCSEDECLVDADCPAGTMCTCRTWILGSARFRGNLCLPTGCRTDADCPGGTCLLAAGGLCNSVIGKYCHRASDACGPGGPCCQSPATCSYSTETGHWGCVVLPRCSG